MMISFFEEFPTKENLDKLKFINWPTKLYLGAKSLEEFNKIKAKIKNKNVTEFIYWPILEIKEGYWISPFSKKEALNSILDELKDQNISIMIDAELPTTKNPFLYLTQAINFFKNRNSIKECILDHPRIYIAEYYPKGILKDKIFSFLGLNFDPKKFDNKKIKMLYHSLHKFNYEFTLNYLKEEIKKFGPNFIIAYGTIAKGIQKNEPIISYEQLKKDLDIAKMVGANEVIIYRLGGLNKEYYGILKKFQNQ